jgi:putative oxidoreductase
VEQFGPSFDLSNGFNLLRIICGAFLIPHLFVKFRNQAFVKGFMQKAGLNPPGVWLYGAFAVEILASIGLIFDIYTCQAALLAGVFLLFAAWASWKVSGGKWMWNFGGAEFPLFWAICCFVVAIEAAPG